MTLSPFALTTLFLCGAVLSLVSAAAGAFLTLWCAHVARTGCNPRPSMPKMRLFKRQPADEDPTNGQQARKPRVGP